MFCVECRARLASRRRLLLMDKAKQATEFGGDVLRVLDQSRTVANQAVATACLRIVNRARNAAVR